MLPNVPNIILFNFKRADTQNRKKLSRYQPNTVYKLVASIATCTSTIPYNGKFSHGANFCIFRIRVLHAKIKTTKISTIEIFA